MLQTAKPKVKNSAKAQLHFEHLHFATSILLLQQRSSSKGFARFQKLQAKMEQTTCHRRSGRVKSKG
jgi:hypothetical protein